MPRPTFLHAAMDLDQHVTILDEGGLGALEHLPGHLFIVGVGIAVLEPEISCVVGIDRGHEIIRDVQEDIIRQVGIVAAGAGAAVDRHVDRRRGKPALIMLLAVAIAGEGQDRFVIGRWRCVHDPA